MCEPVTLVSKSTCPLLAILINLTASVSGKHSSSALEAKGKSLQQIYEPAAKLDTSEQLAGPVDTRQLDPGQGLAPQES